MENYEITPLLQKHSLLKRSVGWVVSQGVRLKFLMSLSEAAFFHYTLGRVDQKLRDTFFDGLAFGVGLSKHDPVYMLREKLIGDRASQSAIGPYERRALIIKAWNAVYSKEKISGLRFMSVGPTAETFPTIAGLKK
jgi:hypothetical protein